jgi:hypothetical protein
MSCQLSVLWKFKHFIRETSHSVMDKTAAQNHLNEGEVLFRQVVRFQFNGQERHADTLLATYTHITNRKTSVDR